MPFSQFTRQMDSIAGNRPSLMCHEFSLALFPHKQYMENTCMMKEAPSREDWQAQVPTPERTRLCQFIQKRHVTDMMLYLRFTSAGKLMAGSHFFFFASTIAIQTLECCKIDGMGYTVVDNHWLSVGFSGSTSNLAAVCKRILSVQVCHHLFW